MRLFLSLPVLVVVLSIVLEGPASTQATPDLSRTVVQDLEKVSAGLDSSVKEFGRSVTDKLNELGGKLKEFGQTLKEKATNFKNSMSSKLRDWFG